MKTEHIFKQNPSINNTISNEYKLLPLNKWENTKIKSWKFTIQSLWNYGKFPDILNQDDCIIQRVKIKTYVYLWQSVFVPETHSERCPLCLFV